MTLPEQSDRAVAQTRQFLLRLASPYVEDGIKGMRHEVRAEAAALLRHYPYAWQLADNASEQDNVARLSALQALSALDEELSLPRRTTAAHAAPPEVTT